MGKWRGRRQAAFWAVTLVTGAAPLAGQTTATLRQAASARGIPIGAAAGDGELSPDWITIPQYASLLSTQYDMLEPGNAMKWWATQPTSSTSYDFTSADTLVAFAQANGMRVRGHNLCWYSDNPQWLTSYAAAPTTTAAGMATLLENHITKEVSRYAGQVFAWDVVNEAFSDSSQTTLRDSIWYNQPGIGLGTGSGAAADTGYIEQAFRWAHAADPNALLFYNDYNIEGPGAKFNAVLDMVTDFVNRGVPINGVGFEMHLELGSYPGAQGLTQNMQQLAALGIQVHITEMDVRLPVDSNGEATEDDLNSQAQIYQYVMDVCLKQPNCTAFQVWGVSYNDSWIPGTFPGYGAALPFDSNYKPTAAFDSLLSELQTTVPPIHQNYVVNSASYQSSAVAPGELVTIYGASAGPASGVSGQLDASGKFPTSLGGVQVLFGSTPAPLLYAGPGQVNASVPFEVAGEPYTVMQYQYNVPMTGLSLINPVTLPVTSAAPAVFSLAENGGGPGAILNQDYSVNGASNPAAAGTEIQIFGTGGGAVEGGATDGATWPAGLGSFITQPITATIGGMTATVDYAGPAPYLVNGAMQVNLTVPSGLTTGPQPVVITIGAAQSQPGITVAVK